MCMQNLAFHVYNVMLAPRTLTNWANQAGCAGMQAQSPNDHQSRLQ